MTRRPNYLWLINNCRLCFNGYSWNKKLLRPHQEWIWHNLTWCQHFKSETETEGEPQSWLMEKKKKKEWPQKPNWESNWQMNWLWNTCRTTTQQGHLAPVEGRLKTSAATFEFGANGCFPEGQRCCAVLRHHTDVCWSAAWETFGFHRTAGNEGQRGRKFKPQGRKMLTTHWTEGQFRVQRAKRKEGNMDFVPQSINQQVVCGAARCCEMYQNINGPACGDVMVSGMYIYSAVLHNMTRHMKLQEAWHPYAED